MNFIAHLFLSGDNEEIITGNLLGDFMKGRKMNHFSEGIQKGIAMHRVIDKFTDQHPVVVLSKERLRPLFRHYSPVVADVFYDHFLAANWNDYSDISFKEFTTNTYKILRKHRALFPPRFQQALAYMRFRNVLLSYSKISGVDFAFNMMIRRTNHFSNLENATIELKKNYDVYLAEFREFFPQLQEHVMLFE